ncbi:MAG: nucleotide sugar dehydrogenase [Candidatus Poseidoniales archaeon]|nr:nucleotide sugar dehydrogenase [Candidatus Poseidoniales archaeon]
MGWDASFASRADSGDLSVGIIGLGYVGLPTAIGFRDAGFNVWGVDVSERIVNALYEGRNPLGDPDLDDMIPAPGSERWNITRNTAEATAACDVLIVTVPTPVSDDLKPDLSYVESAGRAVFEAAGKGNRKVVILESTVYPGVTTSTWLPILAELGLVEGEDIEVAYCPERFNPGDPNHGVRQVARVIGCSDPEVGESLVHLYRRLTSEDVRYVGKVEVAEATKVIENVQRDINIALVNELAQIFPELDLDVEDVLSAAATKWNFHRYTPGIGVGGHCIPVDPYYMMQRAQEVGVPAELITAARAVNRMMPRHVAGVLRELMYQSGVAAGEGRVLFLGWSYKAGVGDARETPTEPLAMNLIESGISVSTWDPYLSSDDIPDGITVVDDIGNTDGYDMVVLATAHPECMEIDWAALLTRMRTPILYDGRRVLNLDEMQAMGWKANAVGSPPRY